MKVFRDLRNVTRFMQLPKEQRRLIEKLLKLWDHVPGWRLCQVVSNLHGNGPQDIFHTYDDQLETHIDEVLKNGWK